MTDETVRLTARITGVVQGVGFRYWTARKAEELLLTGTVRNDHDGSVQLVAEGEIGNVSDFTDWLHSSRVPGQVADVEFQVSEATGAFDDFRIID